VWAGAYYVLIRPSQLRWGATPDEVTRPLPGDDLVARPSLHATRAITIAAPPEKIWPWIVQIGYHRAGFYGYDLIENLGSKSGIRSAVNIIPKFQHLSVGDKVYMSRIAWFKICDLRPNRILIWCDEATPPQGAFTFALFPLDEGHTRVVVRARIRFHWSDRRAPLDLFTEFGDHVAVPRMLLGMRDRIEGRPATPLAMQALELASWTATLLEFTAALFMVLARRYWWRQPAAALISGAILLFVLYARAPLWIGILLQCPAVLAMRWAWRGPGTGLDFRK